MLCGISTNIPATRRFVAAYISQSSAVALSVLLLAPLPDNSSSCFCRLSLSPVLMASALRPARLLLTMAPSQPLKICVLKKLSLCVSMKFLRKELAMLTEITARMKT